MGGKPSKYKINRKTISARECHYWLESLQGFPLNNSQECSLSVDTSPYNDNGQKVILVPSELWTVYNWYRTSSRAQQFDIILSFLAHIKTTKHHPYE